MRVKPINDARWRKNRPFLFPGWHLFEETLATAEQTRRVIEISLRYGHERVHDLPNRESLLE